MPLFRQPTVLTRTPNTSRRLPNPERGALAILRSLAPRRHLSLHEAAFIGELQAYRLLELAGLGNAPVPSDLILDLPRLEVHHDLDLPVSGTTHWLNGRWIITVNASEPLARQRFTLAHELKHVIDHRHRDVLYADLPACSVDLQTERAADNFAACLLMPKRWVKK
ncbi:MAG: ImmA/IrrE family metallo-endopeptidase, partial [Actinobacteria bacterium]|nr:ImmA/IrrE family metallo-endopeptidase [Actinomycetota bacterium]